MRVALLVIVFSSLLTACATAPRGPASKLADAGMKTTDAFSTDVRDLNVKLSKVDILKAYTSTWHACQNPTALKPCETQIESDEVKQRRLALMEAIELRAKALDGLHAAYEALNAEASYDAKADLSGAVSDAVTSVNAYSSKISGMRGAAPDGDLISKPLSSALKFGAGLWAEQKQKKRLLAASQEIQAVTQRLHDTLKVEAFVFKSFSETITIQRQKAQAALLQGGLISGSELIRPMATNVGGTLVKDADALIAKSPAARTAIEAAMIENSKTEARLLATRYDASIGALNALIKSHKNFEVEQPVDISDVIRFLTELNAAIEAAKSN